MPDYLDADGNFDREAWLNAEVRPERDSKLNASDSRIRRFENQFHACLPTTESTSKLQELREYMQALRDLPNNESLMPENLTWPEVP